MVHSQGEMIAKEGKWCEGAICELLRQAGARVIPSTPREDHVEKEETFRF